MTSAPRREQRSDAAVARRRHAPAQAGRRAAARLQACRLRHGVPVRLVARAAHADPRPVRGPAGLLQPGGLLQEVLGRRLDEAAPRDARRPGGPPAAAVPPVRQGDEQTAVFTRICGYPPLNICPPLHHGCRAGAPPSNAPTLSTRSPSSESPVKTLNPTKNLGFFHPLQLWQQPLRHAARLHPLLRQERRRGRRGGGLAGGCWWCRLVSRGENPTPSFFNLLSIFKILTRFTTLSFVKF